MVALAQACVVVFCARAVACRPTQGRQKDPLSFLPTEPRKPEGTLEERGKRFRKF